MSSEPEDGRVDQVKLAIAAAVALLIGFAWGFANLGPFFNG